MRTPYEAQDYISEAYPPLAHLFQAISERETTLGPLMDDLFDVAESVQPRNPTQYNLVLLDGWRSADFVKRLGVLDDLRDIVVNSPRYDFNARAIIGRIQVSEDSLGIIAGAVLQVGRQALSYRFGHRIPKLPKARRIHSQSIVNVIWYGRNHAMHWEERAPSPQTELMLTTLEADSGIRLPLRRSTSYSILHVLDWKTEHATMQDLQSLVVL